MVWVEERAMFGRVRVGPEPGLRPVLISVLAREVENKKVCHLTCKEKPFEITIVTRSKSRKED